MPIRDTAVELTTSIALTLESTDGAAGGLGTASLLIVDDDCMSYKIVQ